MEILLDVFQYFFAIHKVVFNSRFPLRLMNIFIWIDAQNNTLSKWRSRMQNLTADIFFDLKGSKTYWGRTKLTSLRKFGIRIFHRGFRDRVQIIANLSFEQLAR